MSTRLLIALTCVLAVFAGFRTLQAADSSRLELQKGDHISYIGGGLADRMQHDGYLESLIYKAYPTMELTFRNLASAADEVVVRVKTDTGASRSEWLAKTQTDVLFAFYGFNESFAGSEGLPKFKQELDGFLKDALKSKYNGKSAPRLVLFSPIAQEKLTDPNMPDSSINNKNLAEYTAAMDEVAKANNVQFVDLYFVSQKLYSEAKEPLTFNGIHLTEAGNKALAPYIFKAVFGAEPPPMDAALEKLRQVIVEKNETWHDRYRTVDSFNIFGGRSSLSYPSGKSGVKISNAQVMHEEMAQRDVMTANRDKVAQNAAQGQYIKPDDSNLPPVEKVETNHPGKNPDGSHVFNSGEDAIKFMTVPKGCKVNLFASEEQFPELVKPVQMAWDTKGRLWVAAWPNYPERTPDSKDGDKILILEDTDGDGKADKCTTFMNDLNCPTGFQFYKDGILVMRSPDLLFVRDTNGDGKADWRERVLMGLDAADSHHETNSMVLDPGGATYLSDGVFMRTQVETAAGPVRNTDGCIYRYEPLSQRFERYVPYGFANPHGRSFDYWGNDIITDGTGNENFFAPAFSGHIDYPNKHSGMQQFWKRPSRPCAGTAFLSSKHFPDDFFENFLNCNVIGMQGVFRVKVSDKDSGLSGETLDPMLMSSDPNFRPTGCSVAPDGSLYVLDWSNAIIGHMQHHLRDPNRDHQHGRIYRITYEGRPLDKPAPVDGQPVAALLELLKEPEDNVRMRAKLELGKHAASEVIPAVKKWVAGLNTGDPSYEHHRLEGLWVHQWHNVVDADLLRTVLRSPNFHARAAATRVLCYWRDRIPDALELLKVQAGDESPRVRLEAVRAASFFSGKDLPLAYEVAFTILKQPTDYYLDYCYKETIRQLKGLSRDLIIPNDPELQRLALGKSDANDLKGVKQTEPVLLATIENKGTTYGDRDKAVDSLAKLQKVEKIKELLAQLIRLDPKAPENVCADLGKMLAMSPTPDLVKVRADLVSLAEKATQAAVKKSAWAAIITADAKADVTWSLATNDASRVALVDGLGMVFSASQRSQFQPKLVAALGDAQSSPALRTAVLKALPLTGADNAKANFQLLAASLIKGEERTISARGLMQLPRDTWAKEQLLPIAESILTYGKSVSDKDRATSDFVEVLQVGKEMTLLMPAADGSRIRKELNALSVSVFILGTLREQMKYDQARLVVEAGKPFEIILQNQDVMPHNLVILTPGSRETIGKLAAAMPQTTDNQGRYFIPNDKAVLAATKLVEPGQKESLRMTAPTEPGDYEYICTFPGHYMIMYGKLVVTKDVDAYLQANPK